MQFHSVWKKTAAVAAAAAVILGSTVTASAAATGTATATVLVREKASTSSTALATIREGGEVTVLSVDGDWALVEDGSRTGYIAVRYLALMNGLFMEVNPIPVKTAMNMMGMNAGTFRMPLCEMSQPHAAALRSLLEEAGLLQ